MNVKRIDLLRKVLPTGVRLSLSPRRLGFLRRVNKTFVNGGLSTSSHRRWVFACAQGHTFAVESMNVIERFIEFVFLSQRIKKKRCRSQWVESTEASNSNERKIISNFLCCAVAIRRVLSCKRIRIVGTSLSSRRRARADHSRRQRFYLFSDTAIPWRPKWQTKRHPASSVRSTSHWRSSHSWANEDIELKPSLYARINTDSEEKSRNGMKSINSNIE